MRIPKKWRLISSFALLLFSSVSYSASFSPEDGTTITSPNVTVTWSSDAFQQWVRAYDSRNRKIFDSGRLQSASGSVHFNVLESETRLKIIFYEKMGDWDSEERLYTVNMSNEIPSGQTLAGLSCSVGEVVKYNGDEWVCESDQTADAAFVIDSLQAMFCGDDEELTRGVEGSIGCESVSACFLADVFDRYGLTAAQGATGAIDDNLLDGFPGCHVSNGQYSASFVYSSSIPPTFEEEGLYGSLNSTDGLFLELGYTATPEGVQACAAYVGCGELPVIVE